MLGVGRRERASADPIADVAADHPALISFTSGSTGQPKGIVRSHGFLAAQNACVRELIAPQREDETDLVAFPVFVIANLGAGRHLGAAELEACAGTTERDAGAIARHAGAHRRHAAAGAAVDLRDACRGRRRLRA